MLESLIAMVIVGLVGAASVFSVARANKLQYQAAIRAQVVDQVRALVMSQGVGLCGTSPSLTVGHAVQITANITCQPYTNVSVTLPGVSNSISPNIGNSQAQIITATVQSTLLAGTLSVSSTARSSS